MTTRQRFDSLGFPALADVPLRNSLRLINRTAAYSTGYRCCKQAAPRRQAGSRAAALIPPTHTHQPHPTIYATTYPFTQALHPYFRPLAASSAGSAPSPGVRGERD